MKYLITELEDTILKIGINRPKKRNALNTDLINEIDETFATLGKKAKCIIIYGLGDHFSAGLDLSELKEASVLEGMLHSRSWHVVFDRIQYSPAPVIVVLHGACVGAGLELASTAHIRVAEASTFYALPEGSRGIFVGGGGAVRIPRLVGMATMTDMMLTGRVYKSEEGHHKGFSQYLAEDGKGLEKAMELAARICENAAMTNIALTNVLPRIIDAGQDIGLLMESMAASIAQSAPEAKERLTAFLEGKAKKVGQ